MQARLRRRGRTMAFAVAGCAIAITASLAISGIVGFRDLLRSPPSFSLSLAADQATIGAAAAKLPPELIDTIARNILAN